MGIRWLSKAEPDEKSNKVRIAGVVLSGDGVLALQLQKQDSSRQVYIIDSQDTIFLRDILNAITNH